MPRIILSLGLLFAGVASAQFTPPVVPPGTIVNPMTTAGDMITGGTAGAPARLPIGTNGQLLGVSSGSPAYLFYPLNVQAFGMLPSASASANTSAFNTAAAAAVSANRPLYIPGGTYQINAITMPAGLSFFGDPGLGTTLAGNAGGVMFTSTAGSTPNISIHDLTFDCNSTSATAYYDNTTVSGMFFNLFVKGCSSSSVILNDTQNSVFLNTYFNASGGWQLIGGASTNHFTKWEVAFGTTTSAVEIDATSNDNVFDSGIIEYASAEVYGVYIKNTSGLAYGNKFSTLVIITPNPGSTMTQLIRIESCGQGTELDNISLNDYNGTSHITSIYNDGSNTVLIAPTFINGNPIFDGSNKTNMLQLTTTSGPYGTGIDSPNGFEQFIQPPQNVSATPSSGGSLTGGTTYYYVAEAQIYGNLHTAASTESSCTPSGGNLTCSLTCNTVLAGLFYKFYRTTTSGVYGASSYLGYSSGTCSLADNGISPTSGTPDNRPNAYAIRMHGTDTNVLAGPLQVGAAGFTVDGNGNTSVLTLSTDSNCSSSASPAVCGSAAAGSVTIAAAATTVTVNTTAVTANSQIQVVQDNSLGTKLSVTCYTAANTAPYVSARTAGTSFTITATAPVTNPACYSYTIVN